jgi:hypothetical protein
VWGRNCCPKQCLPCPSPSWSRMGGGVIKQEEAGEVRWQSYTAALPGGRVPRMWQGWRHMLPRARTLTCLPTPRATNKHTHACPSCICASPDSRMACGVADRHSVMPIVARLARVQPAAAMQGQVMSCQDPIPAPTVLP